MIRPIIHINFELSIRILLPVLLFVTFPAPSIFGQPAFAKNLIETSSAGESEPATEIIYSPGENSISDSEPHPPEMFSFEFRGEPLHKVIETIARITKTDMLYDPVMIGDEIIYRRVRDKTMPKLLTEVLKDTPFDYIVLSSGTVVIVRKVSEEAAYGTFSGKVRDSQNGKPLYGASVILADATGGTSTNRNGNFYLGRLMSGSYRIVISYVGYQPVEKIIDIQPDERMETEITLEPGLMTFVPVVIRAHRPNLAGINRQSTMNSMDSWNISGGNRNAIRSLNLFPGLQYGLPMQDIHLQGGRQGEHRIRLDGVPVYNPYHIGHIYSSFSPIAIGDIQLHKAGFGAEQGSMIGGIIDFQHDIPYEQKNHIIFKGDPVDVSLRGNLSFPFGYESGTTGQSVSTGPITRTGETNTSAPLAMTATVRSNLWDLYQDPVLKRSISDWDYIDPVLTHHFLNADERKISEYRTLIQSSNIRYSDGHFAVRYEPDQYNTIRSSLYFGQNQFSSTQLGENVFGIGATNYLFAMDQFDGFHMVGQLSWDTSPDPRMNISTQIGFSTNRMEHFYYMETRDYLSIAHPRDASTRDSESITPDNLYDSFSRNMALLPSHIGNNRIDHGVIRSNLSYSFTPDIELESGVEFNLVSSEVDFSEFFYRPVHTVENSSYAAYYVNINRQFGNYWQMTAGTRSTLTSAYTPNWEPRISVQYDRPDSRIGYWTGRIAGGIYRQFVHQYDITNVGPTSIIPYYTVWSHSVNTEPPKAYHLSGSWINKPTIASSIKLESYYKWEPRGYIPAYSPLMGYTPADRTTTAAFSEPSRLQSWGTSARYYHHIVDNRIRLMMGYDYTQSKMSISHFNRVLPSPWNEPHRVQLRAVMRLPGQVSVLANWKSVYGRTWGFRQAYYDYLFLEGVREIGGFTFENPENDRLGPFHQLDVSFVYQPAIRFVQLDIRFDLINVLNRRNVIDWSLRPVENISDSGVAEHSGTPKGDMSVQSNGGNGDVTTGESEVSFEIRERTMPGFYPTFRIELKF